MIKYLSFSKVGLLCAGLLLFSPYLKSEPSDLEALLHLADEIKSTDYSHFSQLLIQLDQLQSELQPEQLEQLQYLKAYQLLYVGDKADSLSKLLELASKASSTKVRFKSYGLLLNSLVISRQYSEVFKYLDAFNELLALINDKNDVSYGYVIQALIFNQINQFEIGLYYAQTLIDSTESSRYRCIGMQLKAESLFRQKRVSEFDLMYDEAVQACTMADQPVYAGIIRSYRIERLIIDNPVQALNLLEEYTAEVESTSYKILQVLFKALLSDAYLKNDQVNEALESSLSTLENVNEDEVNYAILYLYNTLYKASKVAGKYQDALKYQEILVAKRRTYEDEKTAGLLAYNVAKAEVEVKNQRIELLNKDNELLYLQKNVYEQEVRQTRVLIAVLGIVLFIAVVLAYKGITGRRRFKKMAEFDQLTGISNRYHFNNQAALALGYCEQNDKPASLILFDLDHFKAINDNYGHAVGDWTLVEVVNTCRNFMRNNDVFGRIGGEEFVVVLPGCHTDKAILLAEICRDAIANIDTAASGKKFDLTASFGVTGSDCSGYQLKQMLADADTAMYRAKDAGRNKVAPFAETDDILD